MKSVRSKSFSSFCIAVVVARSEAEARALANSKWAATGDIFTVTRVDRVGQMYVEGPPEDVIYSPDIPDHIYQQFKDEDFTDPGREGRLLSELNEVNGALPGIRLAKAAPADVPIVPALERGDTDLYDFCVTLAYSGEVDEHSKTYLLSRYPKLRDLILEMRLDLDDQRP